MHALRFRRCFLLLAVLGLVALGKAAPAAPAEVPKSVQTEIRAAYQQIADAYEARQPDAVLKHFAPDFTSDRRADGEPTLNRRAFEKETRSLFPGTREGPSHGFQIRVFKPAVSGAVTVVLWIYKVDPIDGKDSSKGNVDGSYSAVHRWVKKGKVWQLRQETLKRVDDFPKDDKNTIKAKER